MKKKVIEKVKTAESTISLVLGIVVVIVAGVILFNYLKGFIKKQTGEETPTNIQPQEEMFNKEVEEGTPAFKGELPTKYIVEKGDNLWKISIKFFGYGYNWVDISRENNLTNPGQIEVGQELNISDVPVKKPVVVVAQSKISDPIEGGSYEVKKGDNLWNISVRAYQDGYKWTQIAQANKLTNPDMIHAGNVLVIPR